jgi:hypothetical protein
VAGAIGSQATLDQRTTGAIGSQATLDQPTAGAVSSEETLATAVMAFTPPPMDRRARTAE